MEAVAHGLVRLVVHLQEHHIWVPLGKLGNLRGRVQRSSSAHSKMQYFLRSSWDQSRQFSAVSWAYLGMEGAAAAAAWGEEVDDDELIAGVEQGIGEVLRGLDLPHVGLQPLLPPPHGLGKRQVHLFGRKERA
jgi:hypothetical protein